MEKSYRIHTNISSDTCLNVNMQQDFDFLEVLSLKLKQKDAYRLHSSNYGVIVGRVLANDAFGIPNAKISVFIERDSGDTSDIEAIYPYEEVTSKDKSGRRYNILPDYSDDECYRVVGTFPNKRLVLDEDVQLDIYDKYWKYSTVTNNAGDFMLFAVPTGNTTIHVEMDLSDIGVLSQKPRDFEYKGYNLTLFDSPVQFKESTNLDGLSQIFSQNKSVFVYPFWGDSDNGVACITRSDVQIQYKFEPTCVFMGSIVSDNEGHAIGHRCAPDIENGMNDQLIAGSGTIEMIRKTQDGLIEEYQIQGNQLIDENGVWCYQIPMNLDFIGTDEYGNIVPTDNPNKGIPTRTQVRFRISKNETSDEGFSRHTAKYLVPMNPIFSEDEGNVELDDNSIQKCGTVPFIKDSGAEIERMYSFGSTTPLHCFRDLYWNNVYSVKNYIPKSQVAHRPYSANYTALKGSNLAEDQNPIPFNKLRIDLPFTYLVICLLYMIVIWIVKFINRFIICGIINTIIGILNGLFNALKELPLFGYLFKWLPKISYLSCIPLTADVSEGNVAYYVGCDCDSGFDNAECPDDMEGCKRERSEEDLKDKIQRNLAKEFKIVKLDLYQDWINGCLYMPLWYWRKRKKKTFLFLTLSRAKNEYCSDKNNYSRLKTYVTCNIKYYDNDFTVSDNKDSMPDNESKWHKNRDGQVRYSRGLIKPVENKDGLTAYYYVAVQATNDNKNSQEEMATRGPNFKAIRLFATDIILLGNLDPKNIYGIPQFYKCLPSTTANIPPIATIEEIEDPNEKIKYTNKDVNDNTEDSGSTITTGMDWNHNGGDMTPMFKTGLFLDLSCTYADTKPKSCINVERLSELGVSFDITHDMAYHGNGESVQYGKIENDGFISKYELDDMENRAMFATMNHIGFIPQEYQDSISGYTTQVPDENTNYLVPKFKYIYPVDFDGRLQLPMELYKNDFNQALFDEKDESYITFKLGAEKESKKEKNSEKRIRHFYHDRSHDNMYDMPLYNNSFFFYFGIKKGSTAIDKFNEMFDAACFQNDKKPFTLIIEQQGKVYCPDVYTPTVDNCNCESVVTENAFSACAYSYNVNKNKAYGRIRITSDDIRTPYSYRLLNQDGDILIEENGMLVDSFVIGGQIDNSGHTVSNCKGWVYKQILNNDDKYEIVNDDENKPLVLTNQEYILELTDANGKTITEKVKLEVPKISASYKATDLGTKFYNSATTRIDYICRDDTAFYGKIEMTSFSVDGRTCQLTNVEYIDYTAYTEDEREAREEEKRYVFCITGTSKDINETSVTARLEIGVLDASKENLMRNCMCDDRPEINYIRRAQERDKKVNMKIADANVNQYFLGFKQAVKNATTGVIEEPAKITFFFYQPNSYVVKLTQGCVNCDNVIADNTSEEIITINNGVPFVTTLNEMPTRFMIDLSTAVDVEQTNVSENSYFYHAIPAISEIDYNIKGWYGLHQEDSYMFSRRDENKTYKYNEDMWEDFVRNSTEEITSPTMKRRILKFKFDKMFKLSEGAYITADSTRKFTFNAKGGVSPILYRMAAPIYENLNRAREEYVLKDSFYTVCPENIANIVPATYSLPFQQDHGNYEGSEIGWTPANPYFNSGFYKSAEKVGNYFAAFTRDGSYISKNTIDGVNIKIERSPAFASISPNTCNGAPKIKGKDITGHIYDFPLTHWSSVTPFGCWGTQKLDGDVSEGVATLPYLRAMYVDRRVDYDLTILAPSIASNFSLYKQSLKQRERPWKSGRLTGWIYNGIEMSYDEDYNIISADTHTASTKSYLSTGEDVDGVNDIEYTAATFNKRLEYTYKYDSAHKCLTCGYQFGKYDNGCPDFPIPRCPKCKSTNIKLYGGEIVEQRPTSEKVTSYDVCKEIAGQDPLSSVYKYEATSHIIDRDDSTLDGRYYTNKKGNFNSSSTEIPSITAGQEKYYTFDDAVTYYHRWTGNWECDWGVGTPRWGKWNANTFNGISFGFDEGYDEPNGTPLNQVPLIKEFFSSTINNFDIRHLYWSLFNYERLGRYTLAGSAPNQINEYGRDAIDNLDNPFYVYRYPYNHSSQSDWYNGDFNRDDVVQNVNSASGRTRTTTRVPYPTKRFIDIGNLPTVTTYNYNVQSCSYNMRSEITDDGKVKAYTNGGENVNLYFNWSMPINVVAPNASSTEYANVTYTPVGGYCGHEPFTDYVKFTSGQMSIAFKLKPYTCEGFEVYTKTPRLIQVLPYIEDKDGYKDIDGIGYFKTHNKDGEFGGIYGDGKSLDDAIRDITLVNGEFKNHRYLPWMGVDKDIFVSTQVSLEDKYTTKYGLEVSGKFFKKDDQWLKSDDNDFTDILYQKENISLQSNTSQYAKVFTVLVDREYRYEDDDNLIRHIRTIQTSDFFDCRDLFMKVSPDLTYVEMRESAKEAIDGINTSTLDWGYDSVCGTTVVDYIDAHDTTLGYDSTKIYEQTLGFEMKFDIQEETQVDKRQNEVFADYSMMSYTFRFHSQNGEQYDVVPSKVEMNKTPDGKYSILKFTLKWPTNMGVIADPRWTGGNMASSINVELFARTTSNFIYKLTGFHIGFGICCGQETEGACLKGVDVEESIKKPMVANKHYMTHVYMDYASCNCS